MESHATSASLTRLDDPPRGQANHPTSFTAHREPLTETFGPTPRRVTRPNYHLVVPSTTSVAEAYRVNDWIEQTLAIQMEGTGPVLFGAAR